MFLQKLLCFSLCAYRHLLLKHEIYQTSLFTSEHVSKNKKRMKMFELNLTILY